MSRQVIISKTVTALDRDGISVAQTTAGAADLTITGALASGGSATLDTLRIVGIFSAADLSAITFTVYGEDEDAVSISEAVTGPTAGATVSSTMNFKKVTRVATSAAVGTNVEVGTTGVGSTKPIPLSQHISPFAVGLYIEIISGATVNCTVQYTPDDVFLLANAQTKTGILWTDHASLTSKTASTDSNIAFPAAAVRLKINSGTDAAKIIVRQAGIWG